MALVKEAGVAMVAPMAAAAVTAAVVAVAAAVVTIWQEADDPVQMLQIAMRLAPMLPANRMVGKLYCYKATQGPQAELRLL